MNQEQIEVLIEKFNESNLTELKIETEGFKIAMKSQKAAPVDAPIPDSAVPTPTAAPTLQQGTAQKTNSAKSADTETITSPVVGTFYRSPAPDAPPFVDVGSKVKTGAAFCIIEAMKVMNKLEAEFPCEIVNILAESGQLVEFGAPLFEVKRL